MEREAFVLHTEQPSVLKYLVLHDHDFELLGSAAAVPGTGTSMLHS